MEWFLYDRDLSYERVKSTQQTFVFLKATIEALEKVVNMLNVNNKDTKNELIHMVLRSLKLTLNIFPTLF